MNWDKTSVDLGTLRVNEVTTIVYKYIGEHSELINQSRIRVTCGCTEPKWNPETKELTAIYTPNPVPSHFISMGKKSYQADKFILINYNNGTEEKLTFTATVIK